MGVGGGGGAMAGMFALWFVGLAILPQNGRRPHVSSAGPDLNGFLEPMWGRRAPSSLLAMAFVAMRKDLFGESHDLAQGFYPEGFGILFDNDDSVRADNYLSLGLRIPNQAYFVVRAGATT